MIKPITKFPTWVYQKIEGGVYTNHPGFILLRVDQLKESEFGKMYVCNITITASGYSKGVIEKKKSQYYCKYFEEQLSLLSRITRPTKIKLFDNLFNL